MEVKKKKTCTSESLISSTTCPVFLMVQSDVDAVSPTGHTTIRTTTLASFTVYDNH